MFLKSHTWHRNSSCSKCFSSLVLMEKTTSTRTNIWHLITILNHLKMITKILQNFTCSLSLFLLPIAPMTMEEIDSMEKDWMKATQTHRLKQTDKQSKYKQKGTLFSRTSIIFECCVQIKYSIQFIVRISRLCVVSKPVWLDLGKILPL